MEMGTIVCFRKKGLTPGRVVFAALLFLHGVTCAGAAGAGATGVVLARSDMLTFADPLMPSLRGAFLAEAVADTAPLRLAQAETITTDVSSDALRFDIRSYRIEGNTLLQQAEIDRGLAPFAGKQKDFGDVQRALEALQDLYQQGGYAGIQVTLPEQELERGDVTFRVVEPRLVRVLVEGNEHFRSPRACRPFDH
jgi:hemolysin activation/secretion protein